MNKTVTIFGSSLPKQGEFEYESAYKIASELAQNGFNICSGGNSGIMEAVSKAANEKGTEAIGVTVNIFNAKPNHYLTTEIKCNTLFRRIDKLIEYGDAFVILPGGTGTLLELSAIWELFNKNVIKEKPVASIGKMWKTIITEMEERIIKEKRKRNLIKYFLNEKDLVSYLLEKLN